MGIQHNHYADPTNKVGCDQWNDEHKIVNMLGYELVEEKILPAGTTTTTFSGLNGNEDGEYLIEAELNIEGSTDTWLWVTPNGITTNQGYDYYMWWNGGGGRNSNENAARMFLVRGTGTFCNINAKLKPKTGVPRIMHTDSASFKDQSSRTGYIARSYWSDTTTIITSLVINTSGSPFNGKIRLWRRIPING